jgi:hypothetical protein
MAFYKNPIIEEPPKCLVCSDVMQWDSLSLICSATCQDVWDLTGRQVETDSQYDQDPEELLYG